MPLSRVRAPLIKHRRLPIENRVSLTRTQTSPQTTQALPSPNLPVPQVQKSIKSPLPSGQSHLYQNVYALSLHLLLPHHFLCKDVLQLLRHLHHSSLVCSLVVEPRTAAALNTDLQRRTSIIHR
jgi:hypothetical protein